MPGFAQFELVELIHDDVANTWLAREPGSGRLLLLHKFSRASGLRDKIRAMNPPDLGMLIKAGEESGLFYVVTYDTPELRQFRRWVESRSKVKSSSIYPPSVNHSDPAKTGLWRPPAGVSSETPTQAPEPKEAAPGEFTRMFQASPAEAPSSEPGTFTRMFESAAPAASKAPAPKEPAADEFSLMFQAPPAEPEALTRTVEAQPQSGPPPSNSSSPAPAEPAPGEFTRMFQAPPAEAPPRQPAEPPSHNLDSDEAPTMEIPAFTEAPAAPSQPAPSEPGSFTRMFQQPQATQPDSAAATKRDEPSAFTRMFNAPGAQPSATENRPAQPEPPPQPAPSEPGSFTRMFQQPSGSDPAPTPPPARPPNNSSSGDFTRFFNSPMQATPLAENLGSAPVTPPEPAPRDPGSFTRMFGAPGSSGLPEPPSSNASSAATGVFSNRQSPSGSTPPPPSGPGEYTRLFSAPAATQDSAPPPAPALATAPAPDQSIKVEAKAPTLPASVAAPKNYIGLVIVLALLAVVAIALILYFALRR
jgi:hypothetical protein